MQKKGFTLIELLVVIAIIGILSSIVLASLNTARTKAADAAIKANLNNTRAQAEIVYDDTGAYATVCADDNVLAATTAANGTCWDGDDDWVISAVLSDGDYFCVDSSGNAEEQTSTVNGYMSDADGDRLCGQAS